MGRRPRLPILPEGYRTVEYVIKNPEHKNKMGVYIIMFGDKFYIGRAKHLGSRISSHKGTENDALGYYLFNKRHRDGSCGHTNKIAKHLAENHNILVAEVEFVDICESIEECKEAEYSWINAVLHFGFHDMCLNSDFFAISFNTSPDPIGIPQFYAVPYDWDWRATSSNSQP